MEVRVDQARVGPRDSRLALFRSQVVLASNLIFKAANEVGCLYELVLVLVSKLSEQVDVLCWTGLQRH